MMNDITIVISEFFFGFTVGVFVATRIWQRLVGKELDASRKCRERVDREADNVTELLRLAIARNEGLVRFFDSEQNFRWN